jgi:large subunit ribosomal protein L21
MSQRVIKSGLAQKLCSTFRSVKPVNATSCRAQRRMLAYASVNHVGAYKQEMEGRHGQQLRLAYEEGEKYKKGVFDPFDEYKIDANDMDTEEITEDNGENDDHEDAAEEEFEAEPTKSMYNKDGSIYRTKAELVSLKAGAPAGGNFAIVNLNGSQHKVTKDDVVVLNKLRPVEKWAVGTTHTLTADDGQILLMGSQEQTLVGLPFVNGGEVDVMVEEITRDKKVIVFKKKRRKNHRRKNGFKREVTFLRVLDIRFPDNA